MCVCAGGIGIEIVIMTSTYVTYTQKWIMFGSLLLPV